MHYRKITLQKIALAEKRGADIVENRNWHYTGKRDGYVHVEKIAQTNDRMRGYPKRVIWACWKKPI
jgi:hypothetical protein